MDVSPTPCFRKLNGAIVYSKIRKFVDSGSSDFWSIATRINILDHGEILRLIELLCKREEFLNEIVKMNHQINERRKRYNMQLMTSRLQSEVYLTPEKYAGRTKVEWLSLSKYLVPEQMSMGTYLAGKRKDWRGLANRMNHCRRKRNQIDIILSLIGEMKFATDNPSRKILDVCGGRGDLSIMLAWMNPSWSITLVDRNQCALQQAQYRALNLGISNLKSHEIDLFSLSGNHEIMQSEYDLVLGLHACGSLTDMILEMFGPMTEKMLIATCCFGKMSEKHRSPYSRIADADVGGNSEASRLAKLVINSQRMEKITYRTKKILEVDEKHFGQKNQILYLDR